MPASLRDALAAAGLAVEAEGEGGEAASPAAPVVGDESGIGVDQIGVGIVVLDLDPILLLEDARVTYTQPNPARRSGPFLCVGVEPSGFCTWTGITRAARWERLEIRPWWREGGGVRWQESPRQFLTDAGALWRGPKEAFAAASWRETFNDPDNLPRLNEHGVAEVLKRMATESHRRIAAHNQFGAGRPPEPI